MRLQHHGGRHLHDLRLSWVGEARRGQPQRWLGVGSSTVFRRRFQQGHLGICTSLPLARRFRLDTNARVDRLLKATQSSPS